MNTELLTVAEVANILRVHDSTVRRWIEEGTLEAVILPHAGERLGYRITRETLDRALSNKVIAKKPPYE